MSGLLRCLGFGLVAAWLVLVAAAQLGFDRFSWDYRLLVAGVVLALFGSIEQLFGRHRRGGKIRDGSCVRCGRRTRSGQIYCAEHIKDALRSTRHGPRLRP